MEACGNGKFEVKTKKELHRGERCMMLLRHRWTFSLVRIPRSFADIESRSGHHKCSTLKTVSTLNSMPELMDGGTML